MSKKSSSERLQSRIDNAISQYGSIIDSYIIKNPALTGIIIARQIIETEKIDISLDTLGRAVNYRKQNVAKGSGASIAIALEEGEKRYEVINNRYKWNTKHGIIDFPVELIDQFFYEYSEHGLNLTQTQMINKHELTVWQWNSIKSTLWLFKKSNIFSPYTQDNTLPEELHKMQQEKMSKLFENPGQVIEANYNKVVTDKYKQVIRESEIQKLAVKTFITELSDLLPTSQLVEVKRTINKDDVEELDLLIVVADLHIGAKVDRLQNTMEFNQQIVEDRLDIIAEEVNARKPRTVTLALMGDLIESLTGLNHKNSWQSMEYGMYGAQVIKTAIEILERFIGKVVNIVEILGVGGNHDRMTSDNQEDTKGQIADIIFYMLERMYREHIKFEYNSIALSREIDGINYIFTHGHHGMSKKFDAQQVVLDYGNNKLFNVICTAHLHTREIKHDRSKYRWYVCPSIFTGNFWSESMGFSTVAGFLQFNNNGNGYPNVTDTSL